MRTRRFIPLLLLILAACSTPDEKSQPQPQQAVADSSVEVKKEQATTDSSIIIKQEQATTSNSDTLIVNEKAAVFYSPDAKQVAKRKKEVGDENFYKGADDYINFAHTSLEFLDSKKLTVLDAANKKYLKFIRTDRSQTIIKLDTLEELWGIYFFDPAKKEKLVDMTVIEEEYKSYFK